MKKLAAIFTLFATALTLTACSNSSSNSSSKDSSQKTEKTSKKKSKKLTMNVKKSDVVGQVYVGCDKDNKNRFFEFFVGKDKRVRYSILEKDGSVTKITRWRKRKLVLKKNHPRTFYIWGFRVDSQQDYESNHWEFTKTKPDTIKDLNGKHFKLYQGKKTEKSLKAYILKNAYGTTEPTKDTTSTK